MNFQHAHILDVAIHNGYIEASWLKGMRILEIWCGSAVPHSTAIVDKKRDDIKILRRKGKYVPNFKPERKLRTLSLVAWIVELFAQKASCIQPLACRELYRLWYNISWVDIRDNSQECFPSFIADITKPEDLIRVLKERTFDIIFDNDLTGYTNPCPRLQRSLNSRWITWSDFLEMYDQSVCNFLTPGGLYIRWDLPDQFFRKDHSKLQRI